MTDVTFWVATPDVNAIPVGSLLRLRRRRVYFEETDKARIEWRLSIENTVEDIAMTEERTPPAEEPDVETAPEEPIEDDQGDDPVPAEDEA